MRSFRSFSHPSPGLILITILLLASAFTGCGRTAPNPSDLAPPERVVYDAFDSLRAHNQALFLTTLKEGSKAHRRFSVLTPEQLEEKILAFNTVLGKVSKWDLTDSVLISEKILTEKNLNNNFKDVTSQVTYAVDVQTAERLGDSLRRIGQVRVECTRVTPTIRDDSDRQESSGCRIVVGSNLSDCKIIDFLFAKGLLR